MSKLDFIKTAATKVVDYTKAADAVLIDPIQNKVGTTITERRQMRAAKGVMKEQILAVGKNVLDQRAAERAAAKEAEEAAKLAAQMESAGLVYSDSYAEAVQNTFAS